MNVQEELLREKIDPLLTSDTIRSICSEACGERVHVSEFGVLTGGCWNRVMGVSTSERELVLKISPHSGDSKIIREFSVLREFRSHTSLPVPEPLLLDAGSRFTPGTMLVMSRIPGVVMHECFSRLRHTDRTAITTEIARYLADLHRSRSTGFGGVELPPEDRSQSWADFWLPRFDKVVDESNGVVPGSLVDGARTIRPSLVSVLDIEAESTMTHYDVWSGNVMVDVRSDPPCVTGFIDVPGYFADYARELSFAMMFGVADQTFFDEYLRHHQIDPGFMLRVSVYNLKMNLRHIQMYPGEAYYRHGAQQCLEHIERNL